MPGLQPLSTYPAATLHAMRAAAAALLRYQDILPTDLSIKLGLLHGDLSEALRSSQPAASAFVPLPATRPLTPTDNRPPERHPR